MERSYLLPDGSVGTNDVAVPGGPAHHPGITPGGVIYGDRDNSTVSGPRGEQAVRRRSLGSLPAARSDQPAGLTVADRVCPGAGV